MPVYFAQAGENGPIKIGFATNVVRRMWELQVNSPDRIQALGTIEGDQTAERALHRRFSEDRISGEWFRPSSALLSLVETASPVELPAKARKPFDRPSGRAWRINEIIDCAGGLTRLADIAGVDHSTVCGWRRRDRVPTLRARPISEKLGIPLHEIRPDVWRATSTAAD